MFIFPRDVKFFESIFPFKDSVTKKAGVNTVDFPSSNSRNDAQSSDDIFAAQDEQTVFPRNYNDFVIDSKVKTDAMNNEMDALLRNDTWKITELPKDKKAIDSVMSSASTVTYTSVYTDSEPGIVIWGAGEELFDGGSPRVIVNEYDGLPMQTPLPVDASPTALSSGYLADFDLDKDPEEDPEEDHTNYPVDGRDNDDDDTDDENEEPFEDKDDDEEEEEHLAPADHSVVPAVDPVPSAGDTEAFETDESAPTPRSPQTKVPFAQTCLRRARKMIRLEPPMSPSMEARIAEYAAAPTPPPSPLSPWYEVGESSTAAPRPTGGHRVDYGFIGTLDAETRCQRAEEVGYVIRDVWVDPREVVEEVAPTTLEGVNTRVTELASVNIYVVIEDAQDKQTQLS
ncbi:hypothetical protein Tco_0765348 [Tanacetum coccineum]